MDIKFQSEVMLCEALTNLREHPAFNLANSNGIKLCFQSEIEWHLLPGLSASLRLTLRYFQANVGTRGLGRSIYIPSPVVDGSIHAHDILETLIVDGVRELLDRAQIDIFRSRYSRYDETIVI
jgi:hypothetical protein